MKPPFSILRRIVAVALLSVGLLALAPAAILLNQRFHLIRTNWGIFDIEVNRHPVSESAAIITFSITGLLLIVLGTFLLLRRMPPRLSP